MHCHTCSTAWNGHWNRPAARSCQPAFAVAAPRAGHALSICHCSLQASQAESRRLSSRLFSYLLFSPHTLPKGLPCTLALTLRPTLLGLAGAAWPESSDPVSIAVLCPNECLHLLL